MGETKDTSYLSKFEQLEVVLATNPAEDEDHVWIRTVEDVLTYEEAVSDTFGDDIVNFTPDYTAKDIRKALKTGKIAVYSSKTIVNGNFVTPSAMYAKSYSANGVIYKAEVNLKDVAWIEAGQGQLATNNNIKYSKYKGTIER